jgi:hypothetical protein
VFGVNEPVIGAFQAEQQRYHYKDGARHTQQGRQQVLTEKQHWYRKQQTNTVTYPQRYPPNGGQQQVMVQKNI